MSTIGEVLGLLTQAQENVASGHNTVADARERLHEIAANLGAMGIEDRAQITAAAAQSTEEALSALAGAIGAVEQAINATRQAGGAG